MSWVRHLPKLFLSHVDAWCVTLVAGGVPLLVHDAFSRTSIHLLLTVVGFYWLAFALNDWYDAPHDAIDAEKGGRNFFVAVGLSNRQMMGFVSVATLVLLPGIVQFGWRGWLLLAIGLLVMWAYSAPPLRLKSRPGLDLLTHMLFVESFPYWMMLFLLGLSWGALDWALLAFALLGSLTAQLEQQARDYEIDRLTDRNFTTTVGLEVTMRMLRGATGVMFVLGVVGPLVGVIPWYFVPFELLALPVLARRFMRPDWRPRSQRLVYVLAVVGPEC